MRVYFSHAMRGKAGDTASAAIQYTNNEIALAIAKKLREAIPNMDLYVPAESEPFVQAAHDAGYLSIEQILELDCKVIDGCDTVVVYVPEGDEMQGGRLREHDHAINECKPVCVFSDIQAAVEHILELINYGGGYGYGRNA
jgi:nucleoside 2-deoxyribosyltransferase